MNFNRSMLVIFTGCLILASSCARARPQPPKANAPAWTNGEFAKRATEVCEIGYHGPALYPKEGMEGADKAGRVRIAERLRTTIIAVSELKSVATNTSDSATIRQIALALSNVNVERAKVKKRWVDWKGIGFYKTRNSFYVLVCLNIKSQTKKMISRFRKKGSKLPSPRESQ